MPPDACASTTAALDLIDNTPEIRQNLWHNTETIRKSLQNLGFDLASSQTQIIPIVIGDAQKTVEISDFLYNRGIYLYGVRPPTVPEGQSRLRLSVMASHTKDDIQHLLDALTQVRRDYL